MKNYLFLFFLLLNIDSNAQNLVSNPSFEEFEHCLNREELSKIMFNIPSLRLAKVKDWTCPSETGTADFFHTCFDTTISDKKLPLSDKSLIFGVPANIDGFQYPHAGKGYAGFYVLSNLFQKDGTYREYLSGRLTTSLKKGRTYKVSFWCNLSDKSNIAVHQLGIFFSKKEVVYPDTFAKIIALQPQVINTAKRFLSDKNHWTKVEGSYTAEGGEKCLLIGCFSPVAQTDFVYLYEKKPFIIEISHTAYYFIDDICVSEQEICSPETDTLEVPKNIELIDFTFDKAIIRGNIVDKKSNKGLLTQVQLTAANGKKLVFDSKNEGTFEIKIDTSHFYYAFFNSEKYLPQSKKIWKQFISEVEVKLVPIEKGAKTELLHSGGVPLSDYTNGKPTYVHYTDTDLQNWVDFLRQQPELTVRINSHGVPYEDKGKAEPKETSEKRSAEIAERMIALGANPKQISYKGFGNELRFGLYSNEMEIIEIGKKITEITPSWDIGKLKVNEKIILQNIYFQPNSAELNPISYKTLDELTLFLKTQARVKIAIYGHTDNGLGKSTQTYLQSLSENRAKNVVNYLVSKGIPKERLQSKGFGMSQPLASNQTEEGRSENRRTEFEILEK